MLKVTERILILSLELKFNLQIILNQDIFDEFLAHDY